MKFKQSTSTVKPSPILHHLPWNVMDKITSFADTETNLALRSSARMLKNFVDQAKVHHEKLVIQVNSSTFSAEVKLKTDSNHQHHVLLKPLKNGYRLSNPNHNWKGKIHAKPLHEGVVNTVMKVLNHPKVSIGTLVINLSADNLSPRISKFEQQTFQQLKMAILDLLRTRLEQRKRPLPVGQLIMKVSNGTEADLLCILPFLKPRVLHSIHLNFGTSEGFLDRATTTDQWRLARKLIAEGTTMDSVPFDAWKHFECTIVSLKKLDVALFEAMAKHYLTNPDLLYAWIKIDEDDGRIDDYCKRSAMEWMGRNEQWKDSGKMFLVDMGNVIFRDAMQ